MASSSPAGKSPSPPHRNAIVAWLSKNRDQLLIGLILLLVAAAIGPIFNLVPNPFHHHSNGSTTETTGVTTTEEGGEEEVPSGHTVAEWSDNRKGSPVFASPKAESVKGEPTRIPYGEEVLVSCWAENESGISSITAFYLIASGTWQGDYVVTDTMTNGGKIGSEDSESVDPEVSECTT
jgi:hypothetical protein